MRIYKKVLILISRSSRSSPRLLSFEKNVLHVELYILFDVIVLVCHNIILQAKKQQQQQHTNIYRQIDNKTSPTSTCPAVEQYNFFLYIFYVLFQIKYKLNK